MSIRERSWLPRIYLLAAGSMLPWMAYLWASLPGAVQTRHWRLAWLGLDAAALPVLVAAWRLARRRDPRALPLAVANLTLILARLWFGVSTLGDGSPWSGPLVWGTGQLVLALVLLWSAAAAWRWPVPDAGAGARRRPGNQGSGSEGSSATDQDSDPPGSGAGTAYAAARDLRQVVGAAVVVMIVQAEAGPLLVRDRPEQAEAAFAAIADAGRQALGGLRGLRTGG